MSRTVTLTQLLTDIRAQADIVGATSRHTDAQLTRLVNQSIQRFRERISIEGSTRYLVSATGTLGSGATSPYPFYVLDLSALSPALVRTSGIDIQLPGNGEFCSLKHVDFNARTDYGKTPGTPQAWAHFRGDQVAILPPAQSGLTYVVWYLPVLADLSSGADTFDGVAGWEDYIVWDVVCRVISRDQYPQAYAIASQREKEIFADIVRGATKVSHAGGKTVGRDTFGTRVRHGLALRPGLGPAFGGGPVNLQELFGNGTDAGDRIEWTGSIWVKRRGWITPDIDLTGGVDATTAIRAALTLANARRGACVYLPEGQILISNTDADIFSVPACTTVTGQERGNSIGHREFSGQSQSGTTLKITGIGDLFTLAHDARVMNLETYYPNQETNATPTAYGWTIDVPANAHFTTIENISCLNAYQFLRATGANGITIDSITGLPLATGIHLGRVADVARVSRVHWIPTTIAADSPNSTLLAWVQANANAFLIDGAEECAFTDCFAYGYNFGIHLSDSDADGFRGTYGSWKGGGLDIMNVCVRVTEPTGLCALGFRMVACGLVPVTTTGRAVHFSDTTAPVIERDRPRLMLDEFSIHNTHDRSIVLSSGSYGVVTGDNGHFEGYINPALLANSANSTIAIHNYTRPSSAGVVFVEPGTPGTVITTGEIVI